VALENKADRRVMERFARLTCCFIATVALTLSGCGPDRTFTTGDASAEGATTSDSGECARGEWYCVAGGLRARRCDGHGGFDGEDDCSTTGQTCVPRLGCRVCAPGTQRCDATRADQTQQCATDGHAWLDGAVCAAESGTTCVAGRCDNRCDVRDHSYLGCEYYATVTANPYLAPGFTFAVVVANPQTYSVRMSIAGGALPTPIVRTLAAGDVQTIELPWSETLLRPGNVRMATPSPINTNSAFHIRADGPVAAYQFNPLQYRNATGSFSHTNDASLLLPTHVLTAHYNVPSYPNSRGMPAAGGFVAVVGVDPSESGTRVTVRVPVAVRDAAHPPSNPFEPRRTIGPGTFTFTVRAGDVLQLIGANANEDITGTLVEADHPVAVFSGHECTYVPTDRPYCDHLEEQVLPSETWGRRYVVTPLRDRGPGESAVVRVLSQRAENALTFEGIPTPPSCAAALNANSFCEFETSEAFVVTGTQPFLVTQFMIGEGEPAPQCRDEHNVPDDPVCWGDPAMVTEVPVDQFRRWYDFMVPETYARSFVNVIAPAGARITLDTIPFTATAQRVGTFDVYAVPIASGRHHIESEGRTERIGLKVYGVAPFTSYMYPGGMDLDPISPPG